MMVRISEILAFKKTDGGLLAADGRTCSLRSRRRRRLEVVDPRAGLAAACARVLEHRFEEGTRR